MNWAKGTGPLAHVVRENCPKPSDLVLLSLKHSRKIGCCEEFESYI
jgi:hypothetical protein